MEYYVSSEFRHKGYGKAMFEHTVSWYNECFLQPLLLQESHSGRRSAFKEPEKDRRKMDWTFMKRTLIYRILPYSVIPVNSDDAVSVMTFYQQNIESLHGKQISLDEWKDVLSPNDEDEQNFLVCRGCMSLAWLRINGLFNKDMAWISMLAVSDKHHRQGIGSYAIEFYEKFVKEKGFRQIGVHTTENNIPAQNLYRKCGYDVTEYGECTTGNGVRHMGHTFVKEM